MVRTPETRHRFSDTRSGCGDLRLLSGGLRYAATTGYYLTALQAEPTRYREVVQRSWAAAWMTNLATSPL